MNKSDTKMQMADIQKIVAGYVSTVWMNVKPNSAGPMIDVLCHNISVYRS